MKTTENQPANVMGAARSPARSINQCLLALGANRNEVYYKPHETVGRRILGRSNRSIYDILSKAEIYSWARWLKIRALKNYHPDKRRMGKHFYTRKSQEINVAFDKLVHILEQR